jgi:hypothetical protein
MLERKSILKRGGAICVFAELDDTGKSSAESNFERRLKQSRRPDGTLFKKPGEHRAFKVLEASGKARLCVVTPNIPPGKWKALSFVENYRDALTWAAQGGREHLNIGVIPSGFSILPS